MARLHRSAILAALLIFFAISRIVAADSSAPRAFHNHSQFLGVETVTVALVQLRSLDVGNWGMINTMVAEAKARGAEFVVFPEASYLGWLNPAVFTAAGPIPGPGTDALAQIAKQHGIWIAFGMAEQGQQAGGSVHFAYDSGVVIDPTGSLVLHNRKYSVLKNAFDPQKCPPPVRNPDGGCNYLSSPVSDIGVAQTPLGTTAILVCADAYTYDTAALDRVKSLGAQTILVVWGVTAGQAHQCGSSGFSAVEYAKQAALYTDSLVIGANAVGDRPYGRFLPSVYCGFSGIVTGDGSIIGKTEANPGVFIFQVPVAGDH